MDQIVEKFFRPLSIGFHARHKWKFRSLTDDVAIQLAIVACWMKFDNFNPEYGTPYNYFAKIIQHEWQAEALKESTYNGRFPSLEGIEDEPIG